MLVFIYDGKIVFFFICDDRIVSGYEILELFRKIV